MKFTIAIPAYKDVYFREAVESVLNQTIEDWELIVLNDCSPGDIEKITLKYTIDSRVRYYKTKHNVGAYDLVDNWNRCLELAQGEYIICMGDDDVLRNDCLEVYLRYVTQYPDFDIFHAATELIDEKSQFLRYQESRPLIESVYSMVWHRLTRKRDQYIGDFLYSVSHLRFNGGFQKLPLAWGSDDITAYRCSMRHGIVNIPEYIFKYRMNRYTISMTGNTIEKLGASSSKIRWISDNIINSAPISVVDEHFREMIEACIESSYRKEVISIIAHTKDKHPIRSILKLFKQSKMLRISRRTVVIGLLYRLLM